MQGKYEGMVGSLICVMESGKQFLVGSGMSDARRANPPPVSMSGGLSDRY